MSDIKTDRKKEIEGIVSGLISEMDFSETPSVDIVSFVSKYDFLVQSAELPLDTTGYLIVDDDAKSNNNEKKAPRVIIVNRNFRNPDAEDNVVLKKSRFITAHEFGHFILHKKTNEKLYAHRDSDKRDTPMEMEADYFARSILMPAKPFMAAVNFIDNNLPNIYQNASSKFLDKTKIYILSEYFKVTQAKVQKRLEDIDLLKSIGN